MKAVSIADYVDAGAECGDAGIQLATELPLDVRTTHRVHPGPDVSNSPSVPARTWGFLLCDDSRSRDPHKYDWMPPDPPRIPRERRATIARFVLIIGCLVAVLTLECMGAVALCGWLARVVG